jgi:hypothetical protein
MNVLSRHERSRVKTRDLQFAVRIIEAHITPLWEMMIIFANQLRQSNARRIDQGMDAVPIRLCGSPIKVRFQNRLVRGGRGDMRRPPRGEHRQ